MQITEYPDMSAEPVSASLWAYLGSCLAIGGAAAPQLAEACGLVLSNWGHVVSMGVGIFGVIVGSLNYRINKRRIEGEDRKKRGKR